MSDVKEHKHLLKRDGTMQSQRFPAALDPAFVSIDGRTEKDRVKYAHELARLLTYFGLDNLPDGDWQTFFDALDQDYQAQKADPQGTMTPHQSLYIAFLRLFENHRKELNGLTKKHLDLYFRDILRIQPQAPQGDQVHLLFDLAKNVSPALVTKGTSLSGGKDADGQELIYALTEDIIVNHAKVSALKSILIDSDGKVHMAGISNSVDGSGEALPEDQPARDAFGKSGFPIAETGFAIASPILWLQEGDRTITLKIGLKDATLVSLPASILKDSLQVYLSGEKEWIGPKKATPAFIQEANGVSEMKFEVLLTEDDDAVSFFDPEKLTDTLETLYPVMKIIPDISAKQYLGKYLHGVTVDYIQLSVEVEGVKSMQAENDQGTLDVSKPFQPFGSRPVKGSGFMIGYEEAFTKNLDSFELKVDWLDVPSSNLKNYYGSAYSGDDSSLNYPLGSNAFKASLKYRKKDGSITSKTRDLFNPVNNQSQASISPQEKILKILPLNMQFVALQQAPKKQTNTVMMLKKKKFFGFGGVVKLMPGVLKLLQQPPLRSGFIRLELLDDFLHPEYPKKYTVATVRLSKTSKSQLDNVQFPKEPYTPVIKTIRLNYKASTEKIGLSGSTESDYLGREIELFQAGAFGPREVHGYLNAQAGFLEENRVHLEPLYENAGELYIGLEGAEAGQVVTLLVQVAEGSSNPLRDKETVTWSLLVNDLWMELDTDYLLADRTDGLIKSGIVKIKLPREATTDNNWLPAGYHWIRASVDQYTDAVCKLIGVHARAATAALEAPEKHLAHLAGPLAASSIKSLKTSSASIKKVSQPYSSFGGRTAETDTSYYTRVSERLRHKNRAVTLFDYERQVLAEFPQVHKVKCLPHTCKQGKVKPGHVTIVLIPDLTNQNALDPLEPRVSKALLNDALIFILELNTPFAEVNVINPEYEKIQLDFQVKFYKEFEFGYYSQLLNQEIISFLSPWVSGNAEAISFGGTIHKSVLLKFIEDREYVDFVTNFKLFHKTGGPGDGKDVDFAAATKGTAILVSDRQHFIHEYTEGS